MRRMLFVLCGLLAMTVSAAVTVTDVRVRQRYPWNGLVDIDYTLAGDTAGMSVSIAVTNLETGVGYAPTTFASELPAAPGAHRVTWSTAEDGVSCVSTNMLAVVSLMRPAGSVTNDLYMVVDLSDGVGATDYSVTYLDSVPPGGWTDEHRTTRLVLRKVYPGTFTMGDIQHGDSYPGVTLTNGFYLGVFETTQRQWELVTGTRPSAFTNAACAATRPVEKVRFTEIRGNTAGRNWPASAEVDEMSFMGRLRACTKLAGFDLPTEAQWEYACRAGTESDFADGENLSDADPSPMAALGRYSGNSAYPDEDKAGDATQGTAAVGTYAPNAWGLYDMHGNVEELCLDRYAKSGLAANAVEPVGPSGGTSRVTRGGSWSDDDVYCTSSARSYLNLITPRNKTGFRVACVGGGLSAEVSPENLETVASAGASWSLDTRAGVETLTVDGTLKIAWSGRWGGDDDGRATVRVADGEVLVDAAAGEGDVLWTPGVSGTFLLRHEGTAGETLTASVHVPYRSVSGAVVTLGPALVYTGNLQTQTVSSVTVDGVSATYEVTANTGKGAGAYELVVAGTGNYTGSVTVAWSIARAENRWTAAPALAGWTYGDAASEPTAAAAFGEWSVAYSATPGPAGDYVATFTVEGTDDYGGLSTEVPFAIAPNPALVSIERALGGAGRVKADGGGWKVVLTNAVEGGLVFPDNLGALTVDLAGQNLVGGEGEPAIRIAGVADEGAATVLTVVDSAPDGEVDVCGGKGVDGDEPGDGEPGIEVADDVREGVLVCLGTSVGVCGGAGGTDTSGRGRDGIGGRAVVGRIGANDGEIVKTAIATPALETLVYTGRGQKIAASGNPHWSVFHSAEGTDVGAYDLMLKLSDRDFFFWADTPNEEVLVTKFAIVPRDISHAEVVLGPSLCARADEQEQTVESVTVDGLSVTYAVSDNRATVLGDYELTITGTGNFTGSVVRAWSIGNNVQDVGTYRRWTLPELGVSVPSAASKTVYSVTVQGLPAGLKLRYNAVVKDKKGRVVTPAKSNWWIEGVPSAAIDWMQLPIYAVVTVGKTTTVTPICLETRAQGVVDLGELPLGTAIVTNACAWLPGMTNGWTVTGLPTGLKFTAQALYTGSGKAKKLKYPARTVYGKATKAGVFTITAKKKAGSYYETLKFRIFVAPGPVDASIFGEELVDLSTTAYEAYSNAVPVRVNKVAGLPAGLVFAATDVYAYRNAKKKTGRYLKQSGQTIVGMPTKAGRSVVTFTKNVKSGKKTVAKTAQIVWTVVANQRLPELTFNRQGAQIVESPVGVRQTALLAFTAASGATVRASGLPKGVSLVKLGDGTWGFQGVVSAATTAFITVTATVNGNSQSQRLAVRFTALPAWARGTFDGREVEYAGGEGMEETMSGVVRLNVTTAGGISGTLWERGTNWTLSAACYTGCSEGVYACSNVVAKYAYTVKSGTKTVKKTLTRRFSIEVSDGAELESRTCAQIAGSEIVANADRNPVQFAAYQNEWSGAYKALGATLFYTSKKIQYRTYTFRPADLPEGMLAAGEILTLKITPKGIVTAVLSYPTTDRKTKKKVTCKATWSTTLVPLTSAEEGGDVFRGMILLRFPPSAANAFPGLLFGGVFADGALISF